MTTTNFNGRDPVTPYHIYLMPRAKREHAYWSSKGEAMIFDSFEAAQAEVVAYRLTGRQIVPLNDRDLPPYWVSTADIR
jgi:hypothetical protein